MAIIKNTFSYQAVKATLNAQDREKLLCALLATRTDEFNFDEEKAAKEFGTPTGNAFRVAMHYVLKKVNAATADGGTVAGAFETNAEAGPNITPKTPKSRKRKADDGDGTSDATPKKLRARATPKKQKAVEGDLEQEVETGKVEIRILRPELTLNLSDEDIEL